MSKDINLHIKSYTLLFREDVKITQNRGFGKFKFGTTKVVYKASDPSGNKARCTIHITLQSKQYIRNLFNIKSEMIF